MRSLKTAALYFLLMGMGTGTATQSLSADFSDPTWPCVQRKVETLSLGLMWPQPVDAAFAEKDSALQSEANALAEVLALRRVELDELRPEVEKFAADHDGDLDALGLVFSRVFDSLSNRRTQIINGIGSFSLGQIELAEKIDQNRLEMDTLLQKEDPDFDRIDALEEQIDWDQVIHTDRQRSIQYLCESPQLIEKRLFALAQMLQQVSQ